MANSTYTVKRSTVIDASAERIYEQIADFHNWTSWSPWEDLDPAMRRTYSGSASGAGAIYTWSGNRKAGQGRMQVLEASSPSKLLIDLVFERPWKSHSVTEFTISSRGGGSEVDWSMTGPNTLMTRVMGIFKSMDSLLGPDFEKGLAKLKADLES
jgi:uncharacterized protein YndB with AHSA1/START domain